MDAPHVLLTESHSTPLARHLIAERGGRASFCGALALLLVFLVSVLNSRAATTRDIAYGEADGQPLLLDAHVPDGPGPFPIAILVHGGGWSSGDKAGSNHPGDGADISPWFSLLSDANYAWFSINYRMAPNHRWPAHLEDLDTAIRWVKAHAAEYKGDPHRIALFGHSAGGHMVMFAATQPAKDLQVQAVVGFAPVTDLVADSERRGGLSASLQGLFSLPKELNADARRILAEVSPITHVHPGMPPILIVHGDADKTVPIQQSIAFIDKLRADGVPGELITRKGVPHSLVQGERIDPGYREAVLAWLDRTLRNPPRAAFAVATKPAWVPDNGDGTYNNPVLFADYSDPDVIRVGENYWLTSSSFSHVPGLPILHSRDLVNWSLVNHALPRLMPADRFAVPRPGESVWAPAIRFHGGRYWIYYPDPDFGIYVVTADDPRKKWSDPVLVLGGKGLIDPCPFWDDDGQAYLIHGWAKSRSGISNRLTLRRLSADGLHTVDHGNTLVEGADLAGWRTIEGPKLYRRGSYYYIFAPAGGVTEGYQAVFRSKAITGPYEARIVLEQGKTSINGPHQGAWVDTPSGESWFVHFQDRGPYGRIVHLEPMRWREDGWPEMGEPGPNGVGQPVLRHAKPAVTAQPIAVPATSDDFSGPKYGLQWQWQANPDEKWATIRAGQGLSLTSVAARGQSLWDAPNLLLQKFPAPHFVVTTRVDATDLKSSEDAGLVVFGYSYAWIGLRRTAAGLRLVFATCPSANEGGTEKEIANIAAEARAVLLRVAVDDRAQCSFSYSTDGNSFTALGAKFQATVSRWVGAKVGVFAQAPRASTEPGHADFAWFRVTSD